MQTNRTTSRRTLALIQIWASEAVLPLSRVPGSLSHGSRPYPGVVGNDVPTERAGKVLPWGLRLTVLRLVRTIVSWLSSLLLSTHVLSAACRQPFFIPWLKPRGFQMEVCVRNREVLYVR
jgi:hypothetical protein